LIIELHNRSEHGVDNIRVGLLHACLVISSDVVAKNSRFLV
jgi:hypothetical protein